MSPPNRPTMAGDDNPSIHTSRPEGRGVDSAESEATASSPGNQGANEETATHGSSADPSRGEILSSTSKTWGPLELRRTIGQGRFGTVYVAWDPGLEREVALKILHEADQSAAVIQEARLLARVRHPNVVTVYGVDRNENAVGLWMELIEGLTLKQVLAVHDVFGAQEAALIGIDLCRAVAAVHKAGLLHRDIKVQNVMREAGGRIVLMDFGAGELRAEPTAAAQQIMGTPVYVAPEIFNGAPATIASDVYSVGVVLYHLVTLQYPVEVKTLYEAAAAHVRGEMTPLSDRRPDLPGSFVRVVERALERDPARRYRSSGAMQQDLVRALELDTASTTLASRVIPARRSPGIAVDGRPAVRQSRTRSGSRVLLQRTRRRTPDVAGQGTGPARRVANLLVRREADRHRHQEHLPAARRRRRARGNGAQGRRSTADYGAAGERRGRLSSLVGRLRSADGGRPRRPGRNRAERRRPVEGHPDARSARTR